MKFLLCSLAILLLACTDTTAQDAEVGVGSPGIDRAYLVNRSVFQRLSWIDPSGHLTASATLNCVTLIDSVHQHLIYLQLRNDGKRDSTVAHWPDLKPVYTSTTAGSHRESYDFQSGNGVKVFCTANGKVVADSMAKLSPASFDSYLTDYLIGALPLKAGYTTQFTTNSGQTFAVRIKEVMTDVVFSPNGQPVEIWLVHVESNGYNILYWVDKSTREMLKSVIALADGSVFMKSKI
ncbi:hypothetical protein [Puia sp.]|jgi:hypothetical protein|uniref:DUF3108 domain-containing protein n=1 Tax=Puia sp. TaxID=2045100 RepID=UPI002F410C4F